MFSILIIFPFIASVGIVILSPLLALTIFISFLISKSKLKMKKYYGFIATGFWLVGLICFWCYAITFVPPLLSTCHGDGLEGDCTITMLAIIPLSGSFVFNAVASFFSYRSFVKKYNAIPISHLTDAKLDQNIQSEDEVIIKS